MAEMELPPFNFEDFNKWRQQTSVVVHTDMPDEILNEAKEHIVSGFEKYLSATGVNMHMACKFTKESMDKQFGPAWHVVMGEGFSFDVTRQAQTTLYMYYGGKVAVLMFKC